VDPGLNVSLRTRTFIANTVLSLIMSIWRGISCKIINIYFVPRRHQIPACRRHTAIDHWPMPEIVCNQIFFCPSTGSSVIEALAVKVFHHKTKLFAQKKRQSILDGCHSGANSEWSSLNLSSHGIILPRCIAVMKIEFKFHQRHQLQSNTISNMWLPCS
jgi:hypothetical protein